MSRSLAEPPAATPTGLRINVGSGARCPPGWLHADASLGAWLGRHPWIFGLLQLVLRGPLAHLRPSPEWGPHCLRMDMSRRWPLRDAAVRHVYASHVLEHLDRHEGARALREAHRVLEPGGTLRVVVPDLARLVREYQQRSATEPQRAAAAFHDDTGFFAIPRPRRPWQIPLYFVRQRHDHAFLYDEPALRAAIEAAGFRDVRACALGESAIPGILEVELAERLAGCVCLEATK